MKMLPIYSDFDDIKYQKTDTRYIIQYVKKMLPEYIFDTAKLEGNPFTFPEVKTLLDGYTVGGHKLSDEQQILNLRDSWRYIFELIINNKFSLDMNVMNTLHSYVAREEALEWGKFRSGNISIAGTMNYKCIPAEQLLDIFNSDIPKIRTIDSAVEKAIVVFLWGAYNQFYFDGNKRTARLLANAVLISEGYGAFNIHHRDALEYNTLMVEFYDTLKADRIIEFLLSKCLIRIKR